jgi:signal transduction histidine kinase
VVEVVRSSVGCEVAVTLGFTGDSSIECVPEEINQVLTNLIQNAFEACPSDGSGRIDVTGWNEGGEVCLTIRDNGHGISAEDQERVFNAFFTTKEAGRGMGLGLTIVYRVVRAMGGSIEVHSELGQGTEFTLRLPRVMPKPKARGSKDSGRPPVAQLRA